MSIALLPRVIVLAGVIACGGLLQAEDTGVKSERRHERHERLLQRFDTNHDGKLEKSERVAIREARFEHLDANHDGSISHDEFMNRPGHHHQPAATN